MATSARARKVRLFDEAEIERPQPKPTYAIMVGCRACGGRHIIEFRTRKEFDAQRCKETHDPIFSPSGYEQIWKEFQSDIAVL